MSGINDAVSSGAAQAESAAERDLLPTETSMSSTPLTQRDSIADPDAAAASSHSAKTSYTLTGNEAAPFPVECLPSALPLLVEAVAKAHHVPEALPACCVLGVLSAALGKGLAVASGPNRVTFPNLYILIKARSGAGKSQVVKELAAPLIDFEKSTIIDWRSIQIQRMAERNIQETKIKDLARRVSREGGRTKRDELRRQLEDVLDAREVTLQNVPPRVCVEDITPARLAEALNQNRGVLASISTEAGGLFDALVRRSGTPDRVAEAIYLKSYSVEFLRVDRVTRPPILLDQPCLAALWLAQPQKVDALYGVHALAEGGLLPRIMPATIDLHPQLITEESLTTNHEVLRRWHGLVHCLLDNFHQSADTAVVTPTPGASKLLLEYENHQISRQQGELTDFDSFVARWPEWCWRLSVVLHSAKWDEEAAQYPLDEFTVSAAIRIVEWFGQQQLRLLGQDQESAVKSLYQRVLALLSDKRGGIIAADVYHKRIVRSAEEAHQLLNEMEAKALLRGEDSTPAQGGHVTRRFVSGPG